MNKIWIVAKSEFLRRVRSKWFIIATLLAPVFLAAITLLPAVLAVYGARSETRRIAVVDETGRLLPALLAASDEQFTFERSAAPEEELRRSVRGGELDGYLTLPRTLLSGGGEAAYYSAEGGGLATRSRIADLVDQAVEQQRLAETNAPPEVLEIVRHDVPVRDFRLTEAGEEAGNTEAYALIGFLMGFAIYIAVFIYGSQVMYGAMDEKSSRVVEVMVSSVRPFHLLMGKVLGIGGMGLLQMALWSVLAFAGTTFAGSLILLFAGRPEVNLPEGGSEAEAMRQAAELSIPDLSPMFFVWFVLFFLGGYLLFASLFAAIGSAVEQQQDAQGLMMPVTLPIIIPIAVIPLLIESPNSTLAVALSMVPFFSPILMVVRLAVTDVPFWQVALSYLLLAAGFVGAVWVSARIYRVGVLMYGKKATFRDLFRWARYA